MLETRKIFGYTVTSDGRVFSKTGRLLKPYYDSKDRGRVKLSIDGISKNYSISRLVYCLFNDIKYEDLSEEYYVLHIDGDKHNSSIDNLKLKHKEKVVKGANNVVAKLTNEEIEEIRRLYNSTKDIVVLNQYSKDYDKKYTHSKLALKYNVTKTTIASIVNNKSYTNV